MNTNNSNSVVFDPQTETFIPIITPIIDKNERVIWNFTLGIPIDTKCEYENDNEYENEYEYEYEYEYEKEIQKVNFENAVSQITEEITQITDGLTYKYCYGTWLNKERILERNLSVQISVIVLPEIANDIYNLVKNIISKVNTKYELGLIHIQVMKTIGTAYHFLSF